MPTDPTVEYLDRGEDRLGLHVYPEPENGTRDGPVAVIWPATGVPARCYRPFAGDLRAAGLGVVVADLRGTGTSTPRRSRRSRYGLAEIVDDVAAVQDALAQRWAGRRRLLIAHSLGGQAILLHLATVQSNVDGVVLVAVGLPHYRAYPGRHRAWVLPFTQGISATSALLRVWPGWGFGGRQARGVIRDWGYTARHGRYPRFNGTDPEAALRSVRTRVLAITVDGDRYTPPETTDHLVAKLAAAPVVREHYPAARAGGPLDHFTWVRSARPLAV